MNTDIARLLQGLLAPGEPPLQSIGWRPAADVYRVHDGWLVKFDLAGVRPEEVRMSVCGRRLTVEGCRRDCQIEDGQQHYFMEIAYSHFERTIELPRELKQARISTEYRDGMLFVRLTEEAAS
jgi:HSP20 family protein